MVLTCAGAEQTQANRMTKLLRIFAALCVLAMFTGCATGIAADRKMMTLMTYNIHHGEGTDGKLDLERIARIIRAQKPDLVAVQEVDDKAARSGKVAQAEELGRLTGLHAVFGKAMDFQGGAYGQAILSRWPIKEYKVHQLPQRPGREPRIVLEAKIDRPGESLVFASVHLDHQLEEVRKEQAAEINRIFKLKSSTGSTLLAGDFNADPESGTMREFNAWLDTAGNQAAFTMPARNPRKRIDYVLGFPREHWRTVHSQVLNEAIASDHRPVLTRVEKVRPRSSAR